MPWAVIAVHDEDTGDCETHIVPVSEVKPFLSEQEALAFLEKMDAIGSPVVTDEEDNVTATYRGHTLTDDCSCNPKRDPDDPALRIHNAAN